MQRAPTRKGEATRQRLLDAAATEFAARGIAGARVDRIVTSGGSNKAQLYQYFGSKEALFDEVLENHIEWLLNDVALDAADLPRYALALYDMCLQRPELVRLATWMRLERKPEGDLLAGNRDAEKIAAIAAAQVAGHIDSTLDAADVLSMLTAMALSWSPASLQFAAAADQPAATHHRHRTALASAVRKAFEPS